MSSQPVGKGELGARRKRAERAKWPAVSRPRHHSSSTGKSSTRPAQHPPAVPPRDRRRRRRSSVASFARAPRALPNPSFLPPPQKNNTNQTKPKSFKNGLCQLPVYRKPWEHVLAAMAGAAVFEYVSASEQTMVREIERRYAEMGGGAAAPAAAAAGGKK